MHARRGEELADEWVLPCRGRRQGHRACPASTRRRKIPITSLLYALELDGETILDTFYNKDQLHAGRGRLALPLRPNRMRGFKSNSDMLDADTGKVAIEAGQKLPRAPRVSSGEGGQGPPGRCEDLYGHYLAEEMVNPKTGEIYARPATRSPRRC